MRLAPGLETGLLWPPVGVTPFNAFSVPLLNTTILLTSGLTVTWCHHSIIAKQYASAVTRVLLTIGLGCYFTGVQVYEYIEAPFAIRDSVYGCCFFVATGFHGLHVVIGTLFLRVVRVRLVKGCFSRDRHFGFEAAAWY